jgi:purine nucleosidase
MGFGPSVWDGHVLQSIAIGVDAPAVLADIEQTLAV